MLALLVDNLEQHERLYRNQIKLGLREILQHELDFYAEAFTTITTTAAFLAGFSFSAMLITPASRHNDAVPTWIKGKEQPDGSTTGRHWKLGLGVWSFMYLVVTLSFCCSLLTLVYAQFLSLFSARLALRGGETSVEESVATLRAEYKFLLYSLTACVLSLVVAVGLVVLATKNLVDGALVGGLCLATAAGVVLLFRRARRTFLLDKERRFAATSKGASGLPARVLRDGVAEGMQPGRLSGLVGQVDERNRSTLFSGYRPTGARAPPLGGDLTRPLLLEEDEESNGDSSHVYSSGHSIGWGRHYGCGGGGGGDSYSSGGFGGGGGGYNSGEIGGGTFGGGGCGSYQNGNSAFAHASATYNYGRGGPRRGSFTESVASSERRAASR